MQVVDTASGVAILISIILPLYLNSKNKRKNEKEHTLKELKRLSLLINGVPENELYSHKDEVNILLDFSGANIDFQVEVSDCVEGQDKEKALKKISLYKNQLSL